MPEQTGMESLPCGCRMGVVDDTFLFDPCSANCEWYLYTVSRSRFHGREVTFLDLRDPTQGCTAIHALNGFCCDRRAGHDGAHEATVRGSQVTAAASLGLIGRFRWRDR